MTKDAQDAIDEAGAAQDAEEAEAKAEAKAAKANKLAAAEKKVEKDMAAHAHVAYPRDAPGESSAEPPIPEGFDIIGGHLVEKVAI